MADIKELARRLSALGYTRDNLYDDGGILAEYARRMGYGVGHGVLAPMEDGPAGVAETKSESREPAVVQAKPVQVPAASEPVNATSENPQETYTVKPGDSLSVIAKSYGTTVADLQKINGIADANRIGIGQKIKLVSSVKKRSEPESLRDVWKSEEEMNRTDLGAIQGYAHTGNYVVVDKKVGKLTVYDRNNRAVFSSKVKTGASGDDYNTITYVDAAGKIRNRQGNNSTPAGITEITSIGSYHGVPSFQRGRYNRVTGKFDDAIASSFHFGHTDSAHGSNGCVNIGEKDLKRLSKYIGVGTKVYTLPERAGSRFRLSEGKLNFISDNPYGKDDPDDKKRYWDDYNTYSDHSYSPVSFNYDSDDADSEYKENVGKYLKSLSRSKREVMREFGLSSETYNRLALLAAGIAQQESKFGTSERKKVKDALPDWAVSAAKTLTRNGSGKNNRSYGITQMKINGDNEGLRKIYGKYGVNADSLSDVGKSAMATMLRLAYMYNTEVRGRKFTGAEGAEVSPYDVLLYKWMGRNSELTGHTATPDRNVYIRNVRGFADRVGIRRSGGRNVSADGGLLRRFDDRGQTVSIMKIDTSRVAALAKRISETSNADFVRRLLNERRKVLDNGGGSVATHRLSYVDDGNGNAVVFPEVQSSDYGNLLMRVPYPMSYDRAVERGDTVHMGTPDAEQFTRGYKTVYPGFDNYACGGLLRKYELGGPESTNWRKSSEGGYTTPEMKRASINLEYDPTGGFDIGSWYRGLGQGNLARGEENEYWRAYLGLENNVPKMQPEAKTSWDDNVEANKVSSGELPSDFYGTTARMDQMIQVLADTLNTGNILRKYDEYKKRNKNLAPKGVIKHMYEEGKRIMENPGRWTQVTEGPQFYLYDGIDPLTNEQMPLGMLANFGMMWSPNEGALRVHDTYDFPSYVTTLSRIPVRPKEMKIRGLVKFDPRRGSVLLRDGLDQSKVAEPVANEYSH